MANPVRPSAVSLRPIPDPLQGITQHLSSHGHSNEAHDLRLLGMRGLYDLQQQARSRQKDLIHDSGTRDLFAHYPLLYHYYQVKTLFSLL